MELEQILKLRQSVRSYTDQPVPETALKRIIQAAQMAPLAAGDDQTTHLTVVRDPTLMKEIRETCMLTSHKTGNRVDALYGAQAIIFISATDISDDHIEYANAGCVIENMLLQAVELGLGGTYIWGCLRKLRANSAVVEKLRLPEGYQILSAMVVGYPAQPVQERPFDRKIAVTEL